MTVLGQKVLEDLKASYVAQAKNTENDILIALAAPNSIPDHFNFSEDVGIMIDKLDGLYSLIDTVETLEKKVR